MEDWQRDFAETIAKHRRQGWGWRYDGVAGWSTEAIFAQLRELGIDTGAERFRQQAIEAGDISTLRRGWDDQLREEMDTGFWPDFPMTAAPVLWERLTPDLICRENISRQLRLAAEAERSDGALPDVDGMPAVVAAAVGMANYLGRLPAAERAKQFEEIKDDLLFDIDTWLLNLIHSQGPKYPDAMMQMADVLIDCTNGIQIQDVAATLMVRIGRNDQAIERARIILDRFKDDPWAWIFAGDVHGELGDVEEAKRLYAKALAMPSPRYDRDTIVERLKAICTGPGGDAELASILERHPTPESRPAHSAVTPALPVSKRETPSQGPTKKIGRNDPCPCGSGKKYKRCCL